MGGRGLVLICKVPKDGSRARELEGLRRRRVHVTRVPKDGRNGSFAGWDEG